LNRRRGGGQKEEFAVRAIAVKEFGIVSVVPATFEESLVRLTLARPDVVVRLHPERTPQ
jgi:hypothetical protein